MNGIPSRKYSVHDDCALLDFLFRSLPDQSRTAVRDLLRFGRVLVDGTACQSHDWPLRAGQTVEILPKAFSLVREGKDQLRAQLEAEGVRIVYEDAQVMVVEKRSGLPVVTTGQRQDGRREKTVQALLQNYLQRCYQADRYLHGKYPGAPSGGRIRPEIFPVHRIDRDTSGLLVFARDERSRRVMQDHWKEYALERGYTAILEGVPTPAEGRLRHWLTESEKSTKVHASSVDDGGLEAISRYRVLRTFSQHGHPYSVVEFLLETGRKNQIRVQAASIGHPVAGDKKYEARSNPFGRLALHASSLAFRHPATGKVLRFTSNLPKNLDAPAF